MYCPNCGREIPEGTVCPCQQEQPMLSTNPVLHVIKSFGSSKLFLAMAICATASVVLAVLGSLTASTAVSEMLGELFCHLTGSMENVFAVTAVTESRSVISIMFSGLISGIYVVPFWLHYATCRSRTSGNITTHGLTIWKVFAWISIIGAILSAVAVLIVAVCFAFLGVAFSNSPEPAVVIFVVAFVVLFAGVIFALMLASQIAKLRVLNRALSATATGVIDGRVSNYLIVITYIGAILTAIGAVGSMFLSPLSSLASLADAAQIFLMAMLLSRYRKALELLQFSQPQQVAQL